MSLIYSALLFFTKTRQIKKLITLASFFYLLLFLLQLYLRISLTTSSSTDLIRNPCMKDSGVHGSNLPDCQSSSDFLLFKDKKESGGLLHKVEDFLKAMEIAVMTNRTLVDFAPGLRTLHNNDIAGNKREDKIEKWELAWKFGHWFDLENIVYKVTNDKVGVNFKKLTVHSITTKLYGLYSV